MAEKAKKPSSIHESAAMNGRVNTEIVECATIEQMGRESEASFRAIFHQAIVGIAQIDLSGRFISVNECYCRMLGYIEEELQQLRTQDVMHPEDLPANLVQFQALVAGGPDFELEQRYLRKDGSELWVCNRVNGIRDAEGEPRSAVVISLDLTKRKRAEQALRRSEERLLKILQTETVGVLFFDESGIIIDANKTFLDQMGYTRSDVEARQLTWQKLTPPEWREASYEQMKQFEVTGRIGPYEKEYFRKDGSRWWFVFAGGSIGDSTIVEFCIDVSARKKAEQALRESEARFRELAENIDEVFWLADVGLQSVVYVNSAYEKVWGRSCESLRKEPRSFLDAIHPKDRPRVLEALQARADVPDELEYRIIRPDGSVRWISDHSFPIRSRAGNIYRFGGIARDITRHKQTEEELAEHQAQLEEAQALAGLGSWTWDIPTGTLNWSNELYRMFGRKPEEFLPTHEGFPELLHPEDQAPFKAAIEGALRGLQPYDCEVRIVRPDGSMRVLRTLGRVIFDQGGEPLRMTGMAQDITETKQAQVALHQANEQLRGLSRRLFEVQEDERRHLARELHDHIGQALTAAKIHLQWARSLKEGDALVRRLDDSLAIVDGLLQQVRQLSLELRPRLLDDLGLVQALRWYLDQQAQTSGLLVEFFGDPEQLGHMDAAVQTACFRVAQEAVTNVLRHARARKVTVELHRALDTLHLVVRDDGIGFDTTAAQERAERGESLGLLNMRERVGLMGGELDCESEPGQGTTVHAFLPVAPQAHAQDPTP